MPPECLNTLRARGEPPKSGGHTLLESLIGLSLEESKRGSRPIGDLHPLESLTGLSGGGESERRAPKIRGSYTLREPKRPLTRREQEVKPPNWGLTPS